MLHHDNAPIHNSNIVTKFLYENQVKTLKHPPYSPNLSPCDFWLFLKIKNCQKDIKFNRNEILEGFFEKLKKLNSNDFNNCFIKWIDQCHKYLQNNGNYF